MHKPRQYIALLLCLALILALVGCGKSANNGKSSAKVIPADEIKIGVLLPDSGNASGPSGYQMQGIEQIMETFHLDESKLLIKKNVTDTSFEENDKLSNETTVTEEEKETTAKEPESFTDDKGNVIIEAIPAKLPQRETAKQAMSDLLDKGCNVIIATDAIYDNFTAWCAKQYKKVFFLQYRGTHEDFGNLQSYSDKIYEGFYLAGAVAAMSGSQHPGFVAGIKNKESAKLVNAFALGAQKFNSDIKVTARFTNVPLDLSLERTLPLALIQTDKCDFITQSVVTALPQAVASNQGKEYKIKPVQCIGYGYDMQADGGKSNLCPVVYHFDAYFESALSSIIDRTFPNSPFLGGVKEGVVGLSELRTKNQEVTDGVQKLLDAFKNDQVNISDTLDTMHPFADNVTVK